MYEESTVNITVNGENLKASFLRSKQWCPLHKGHYIMIKRSIHQDYITIINIYALNIRAPKSPKQILTDLKDEINNKIILGTSIPYL